MSQDEEVGMKRKKIMFVDDDAELLRLYLLVFSDEFEVYAYSSSATACYLLDETFDLLVTDYRMPQMNGAELAQKAQERFPRLQILMLTAESEPPTHHPCMQKPVDCAVLRRVLSQLLA